MYAIRFGGFVLLLSVGAAGLAWAGPPRSLFVPGHGACSDCHARTTNEDVAEGATQRDHPKGEVCVGCHGAAPMSKAQATLAAGSPGKGVPAHDGSTGQPIDCVTCHDPHGGNGALLRLPPGDERADRYDPVSRLCVGCHTARGEFGGRGMYRSHPVGLPLGKAPVFGKALALPVIEVRGTTDDLSDDLISCVTCHDPHSRRNRALLRWSRPDQVAACTACHNSGGEPAGDSLLTMQRNGLAPIPQRGN